MTSIAGKASRFGLSVGVAVLHWGGASGRGVWVPEKAMPSYTAQRLVRALAAANTEEALSLFVSRETMGSLSLSSVSEAEYQKQKESFRKSIQGLLSQNVPLGRAEFVKVDFRACPEPIAVPKGSVIDGEMIAADLCMYDDLRVVMKMGTGMYSFHLGVVVLDRGRWALGTPVRDFRRVPRKP